jgi:RNase H-like domain found in reverse transcriptase
MSKKFTAAQMNYHMFEMETIAILKALLKWENKLLGRRVLVVTDHKALEFFKTQWHLNSRQAHWMEFLACFDFDITYVKGETNLVADVLSRYYKNNHWDESHNASHYVNADAWLDPKGEDLPWVRFEESWAMCDTDAALCIGIRPQRQQQAPRRADEPISFTPKHPVIEGVEARQHEAVELAINRESSQEPSVLERVLP